MKIIGRERDWITVVKSPLKRETPGIKNNYWISTISLNTYERLTVVIRLLDETATPRMTWTLTNAFPKQITPTDMNSQASEAAIETMVLAHEGMVAEVG